jgi:hypothetical protein
MMKDKYLALSILILSVVSVSAMTQYSKDEIAIPHENFSVEIIDIDGVITRGINVTFNDMTVITARKGAADVYIPFQRISTLELIDNEFAITNESDDIEMRITLKDGSAFESRGMCHHEVTGESDFGRFRIRLDHIRSMTILEMAPGDTDHTNH